MTGVLLLVTLCLHPFSAFAAESVSVEIPVEIEGGGTAVVISEVNCPLPRESSVEVPNGMTENIHITFTEPGDYFYTILAESAGEQHYAPAYYTAAVSVMNRGGGLYATTVLTKLNSDYKPDVCSFVRAEEPTVVPTEDATEVVPTEDTSNADPTGAVVPTQPPKNPPTSRPKTGDDSMLDIYLLICIAASGGLFVLSVSYFISTNRLIGKR